MACTLSWDIDVCTRVLPLPSPTLFFLLLLRLPFVRLCFRFPLKNRHLPLHRNWSKSLRRTALSTSPLTVTSPTHSNVNAVALMMEKTTVRRRPGAIAIHASSGTPSCSPTWQTSAQRRRKPPPSSSFRLFKASFKSKNSCWVRPEPHCSQRYRRRSWKRRRRKRRKASALRWRWCLVAAKKEQVRKSKTQEWWKLLLRQFSSWVQVQNGEHRFQTFCFLTSKLPRQLRSCAVRPLHMHARMGTLLWNIALNLLQLVEVKG